MTPAEAIYWRQLQRKAADLDPEVRTALLRALQLLRSSLTDAQLTELIARGPDAVIQAMLSDPILDRALLPVRTQLRLVVERGVRAETRTMPNLGRPIGVVSGTVAVGFDILSPNVITAIRALETRVMQTLKDDIRETVRAYIENGLRDGVNPRDVARDLRAVIGLAPNQAAAVRNFEAMLRGGPRASILQGALDAKLRDRRFDATLKRLKANGGRLSESQIQTMTDAYRRKMLAFNAETNARTATLDALKLGQHLAWTNAVDTGVVDGDRLEKTWVGVMDSRERDSHVAMEGETVMWDQPYSNGQMIPGDSEYNCRCISRYRLRPIARPPLQLIR